MNAPHAPIDVTAEGDINTSPLRREFEADASGARLLGTGEPLASALEKLELGAQRIPVNVNPAQAQAYIVNPLRTQAMARLFSTHPDTAERVARLRSQNWQFS